MNEQITALEMRVIDHEGKQLGVLPRDQALQLARERGSDLVLLVPEAKPPVCKVIDYGKFRYELEKKERENRKKQRRSSVIKEIKLSPKISDHDFLIRVDHTKTFLEKGHKVKVTMYFRGREITHRGIGEAILRRFSEALGGNGLVETPPRLEGKSLTIVLTSGHAHAA